MNHRVPLSARTLAISLVWVSAWASGCGESPTPRPDVILVVVDSLRADHLSHLGYERPTAAPLDEFRDRATLFSAATTPAPWSLPATASLLTGRSPRHHGALEPSASLAAGVPTLAGILKERGWLSAALSHNPDLNERAGLARGFDRFQSTPSDGGRFVDASLAIAWLRELLGSGGGPVFAYLHLMNAHGPYAVPPASRSALLGRPPSPGFTWGDPLMSGVQRRGAAVLRARVSDDYRRSLVEQYDTAVHYSLDVVAALLELLDRAGRYDDALIVVTSDHGEELFDHGGFDHGATLHGEVLRVPLYVKVPGSRAGARSDVPVSTLDVVPTILDLVGLPAMPMDGISLGPLLRGESAPEERPFFHEATRPRRSIARAVTLGRYKLIEIERSYDGLRNTRRLYDLFTDPGETTDLSVQGAEIADELSRRLAEHFREADGPGEEGPAASPGPTGP